MVPVAKGSRQDTDMGLIPSERASKIIRIDIRKLSFDGLGALPLVEGGGAKHSPLTGAHEKIWQKSSKIKFSENPQG